MFSGLIKPTSGSASINGYDIWTDKSKIRSFIGFCPQYNLLFPELTIKEHLQFFGMVRKLFRGTNQDVCLEFSFLEFL